MSPIISTVRHKKIGHRIQPDGKTVLFFAPESTPPAPGAPAPTASIAGSPEITVGARREIPPDDTIIEYETRFRVVEIGAPPASEVVVEPAPEP